MEQEMLNIYDENGEHLGKASRKEVHNAGYCHETFHCWVVSTVGDKHDLFLQIRSDQKRDYPSLLDITAAGHILAHETVEDGIREVEEEIGIRVSMEDLIGLGQIKWSMVSDSFIDKEIAHVFMYHTRLELKDFSIQPEEVSGIVKADFNLFHEFCFGTRQDFPVEGFKVDSSGERIPVKMDVRTNNLVPDQDGYYRKVAERIRKSFKNE